MPGVMYGRRFDPVALQFDTRGLEHVLSRVGGSQLINIKIKGTRKPKSTLVRDVQRDPVKGTLLHVDFYHVDMTERLTTEIPLAIVGESPVAKQGEGLVLYGISAIEVECLPGDLIDAIEVDLAELVEIDQAIYVRDLAVPAGIDILTDQDETIVHVVLMKEEAEEIVEEELAEVEGVEVITEAGEEEATDEE